ncbi:hypothetical protein C7N43_39600, partial [Sphingobacteriales bacterium UPWRP_1]
MGWLFEWYKDIFGCRKKSCPKLHHYFQKSRNLEIKSQMEIKLPDTIEACHAMIRELLAVIAVLENRVKDLERRLGQNSGNSHRPPSSDGFKKKAALVGKQ